MKAYKANSIIAMAIWHFFSSCQIIIIDFTSVNYTHFKMQSCTQIELDTAVF